MSSGPRHEARTAAWWTTPTFPHFLGFAAETRAGANRNAPLPPGTGDERWLEAVAELAAWVGERGARALVVALGVDAAAGDRESPLGVSAAGFRAAGRALGGLGLPTVVVQEGGYDLTAIGPLVLETLGGIEEPAR
jgi:acetoin utilization deacetylase AcuC-like enzyme